MSATIEERHEAAADAHSVLVDDVDDDDELAIVLAVVDEGNPPDLYVPLENLSIRNEEKHMSRKYQ